MTPCIVCHTADPDPGRTIDTRCLDRIDHDLARIAELTRYAADRLIPETRPGNGSRSVPSSRPPLDVAALDDACGHDVMPLLDSWQRLVRDFYGLAPLGIATEKPERAPLAAQNATRVVPDPPDPLGPLRASIAFLRSWLLRIAEDPTFPLDDFATEMRELRAGLEHYDPAHTGDAHGTRLKCPGDHPEGDGRLCHARIIYDRERPRDDIRCTRCDTTWTGPRLLLLALHDDTQTIWAYPADVLAIVDINPSTLRVWAHRGLINRDGARYDIGQVWRTRMRVGA